LRQHNRELKHGGAKRTGGAGRPWEFVVVVHGFPDKHSALSFEWTWQHVGRSISAREAIGDPEAQLLSRKRSVKGKLTILKTILAECNKFFHHRLTLFFFDQKHSDQFDKISIERRDEWLKTRVTWQVVQSYSDMPFWRERNNRKRKAVDSISDVGLDSDSDESGASPSDELQIPKCCGICQHRIKPVEESLVCPGCLRQFHTVCVELHVTKREACPICSNRVEWGVESDSSVSCGGDMDETNLVEAETSRRNFDFDERQALVYTGTNFSSLEDTDSLDYGCAIVDSVPASVTKDNTDNNSSGSPLQQNEEDFVCVDLSSVKSTPVKRISQPLIDLCSP